MKLQTIFNQLITYLPIYTDLFSEVQNVSLTYNAGLVTGTTIAKHNLITGNIVCVKDALEKLQITSLVSDGKGIATATTATNHDLTIGFQGTVNISGATQTAYNGDKTLLSVPTRKTFTFAITGTPTTPATGTIYLNEKRMDGYNGVFIVTRIDDYIFSYIPVRALGIVNGTPKISAAPRIFTGNNIENIIDAYGIKPLNNWTLFINLGGATASKDKLSTSDATYEYAKGREYIQRLIQPINLYVFAPTTKTVNAGTITDTFQDLRKYLINCLAGLEIASLFSDPRKNTITFTSDDDVFDNGAFFVHRYSFETIYDISKEDIFHPLDSIAINSLEINYLNSFDINVKNDEKVF